jgi:hypothetical protein
MGMEGGGTGTGSCYMSGFVEFSDCTIRELVNLWNMWPPFHYSMFIV